MKQYTILIADDHTLVRETWTFLLNTHPHFCVIGECGSGEEAVKMAKVLCPDIVVMDINLPGINGIEATEQILQHSPASKVLGASLHTHPSYAEKMIQKGARGYITKNSSCLEMFEALNALIKGEQYICKEIQTPDKNLLLENSRPMKTKED